MIPYRLLLGDEAGTGTVPLMKLLRHLLITSRSPLIRYNNNNNNKARNFIVNVIIKTKEQIWLLVFIFASFFKRFEKIIFSIKLDYFVRCSYISSNLLTLDRAKMRECTFILPIMKLRTLIIGKMKIRTLIMGTYLHFTMTFTFKISYYKTVLIFLNLLNYI